MDAFFAVKYSYLIPLLPLLGAVISGFFGARILRGQSHWPIWIGVGISAVISLTLLFGMTSLPENAPHSIVKDWYTWIDAGSFKATAGFFFDSLTATMLCVVTGIGFFITVFSAGYMKGEEGYFRFFAYLGLFIFAMTCLVMGNNFIMLYLGWEGVGLCSYLLIGYYYERPSAREAAKKAFLVNRIGDFGFGLGIMLIFLTFGTVSYFGAGVGTHTGVLELATMPITELAKIQSVNTYWVPIAMKWTPFLLMLGAFGKSAQFPLYVWLPDAMEGPTPVSALIHAATMVTAGVYMIVRCGTLFVTNEAAMMTIAAIGAFTALLAATIALRQFDLKKVFAYSTISQLGFMFVGVGCFAPVAGVFHLVTHAFFKALLFLSAGVVMHAMAGELDMRKMSGLRRVLPWTNIFILVGCFALAGFPFFSGFFSKDEIVAAALSRNTFLGLVMLFTAGLTAYYTFRLYFRVFCGELVIPPPPEGGHGHGAHDHDQAEEHAHASTPAVHMGQAHESGVDEHLATDSAHHGHAAHGHGDHDHNQESFLLMFPLAVLTIGALLAGYLGWPTHHLQEFLGRSPSIQLAYDMAGSHAMPHVSGAAFGQALEPGEQEKLFSPVMAISALIAISGILLAALLHWKNRAMGDRIAEALGPVTRLLEAKYWVDEIYQSCIVEPLRFLGEILFRWDKWIIDNLVNLVGWILHVVGYTIKFATQRGYLQGYGAAMLVGVAAILLLIFMH